MDSQIIEILNVSRGVAWQPWAVSYFFLIGLSYASFLSNPSLGGVPDGFDLRVNSLIGKTFSAT